MHPKYEFLLLNEIYVYWATLLISTSSIYRGLTALLQPLWPALNRQCSASLLDSWLFLVVSQSCLVPHTDIVAHTDKKEDTFPTICYSICSMLLAALGNSGSKIISFPEKKTQFLEGSLGLRGSYYAWCNSLNLLDVASMDLHCSVRLLMGQQCQNIYAVGCMKSLCFCNCRCLHCCEEHVAQCTNMRPLPIALFSQSFFMGLTTSAKHTVVAFFLKGELYKPCDIWVALLRVKLESCTGMLSVHRLLLQCYLKISLSLLAS